jgi:hypothetical protein
VFGLISGTTAIFLEELRKPMEDLRTADLQDDTLKIEEIYFPTYINQNIITLD